MLTQRVEGWQQNAEESRLHIPDISSMSPWTRNFSARPTKQIAGKSVHLVFELHALPHFSTEKKKKAKEGPFKPFY